MPPATPSTVHKSNCEAEPFSSCVLMTQDVFPAGVGARACTSTGKQCSGGVVNAQVNSSGASSAATACTAPHTMIGRQSAVLVNSELCKHHA